MLLNLSVIIVNYRTPEMTAKCISALRSNIGTLSYEIIVVDNASGDQSKEIILKDFPEIIWIQNEKNEGFGKANNRGIKIAKGRFILLLNSDVFVEADTIAKCISAIEKNDDLGALTCSLINPDGNFQRNIWYDSGSFKFFRNESIILQKFWPSRNSEITAISGAFMLFKKSVFDEIKPFDPDFFMYGEEMELCFRIRDAGYVLGIYPEAKAQHLHGGSTTNKEWGQKHRHLSNAFLYYKIHGVLGLYAFLLGWILTGFSNALLIWRFDKVYRDIFWLKQKYFFSGLFKYIFIPFRYSRTWGRSRQQLRLEPNSGT